MESGFFNSSNNDRLYDADQMGKMFDGLLQDGVFYSTGQHFIVTPGTGMKVNVGTGKCWYKNTWSYIETTETFDVELSSLDSSRMDTVVIEINKNNGVRENKIKILKGEYAVTNPTPPVPTRDDTNLVWQYAIAVILVPAELTEITASNITNIIGMSNSQLENIGLTNLKDKNAQWALNTISPELVKIDDGTFTISRFRCMYESDFEEITVSDVEAGEIICVIEKDET